MNSALQQKPNHLILRIHLSLRPNEFGPTAKTQSFDLVHSFVAAAE
jgi:hypothetical protein